LGFSRTLFSVAGIFVDIQIEFGGMDLQQIMENVCKRHCILFSLGSFVGSLKQEELLQREDQTEPADFGPRGHSA
jgi:hypothetical protein